MKVKAPKCPSCGRWMYILTDESEEERVDVPPTVEIYWTCDCGRSDTIPFDVAFVGGRCVLILPHREHSASDE